MSVMNAQAVKFMGDTIPYIKRILEKSSHTEDSLREIMKDEEKMIDFSKFLYAELPVHLKMKIREDMFINMMQEEAKNQLKKKKNKKLVFGIKK